MRRRTLDARYPPEPAPASCDFLGVVLETRAAWANADGVGMDIDLRLPYGWPPSPARVTLALPMGIPLAGSRPVVHAIILDDEILVQPKNLISTRNDLHGVERHARLTHM